MEIFIVGVIIVALMAYVSTKIKKTAASAYEIEKIDTEEFSIIKPEGFITPVKDESEFAFEAYSRDYGIEDTDKFRQSEIKLRVYEHINLREIVEAAKKSAETIISENPAGKNEILLKTESFFDNIGFDKEYKIISKHGKIYELEITSLQESKSDYTERIEETIANFVVR